LSFLASFFDHTKKDVEKSKRVVAVINNYRSKMEALSDAELSAKTVEYKERLKNGETVDTLLPEAFATLREAAWRVLGRRQYRYWIKRDGVIGEGSSSLDELIVTESELEKTDQDLKSRNVTYTREKYMEPFDVQMIGGITLHKGMIAEMRTGEGKTLVAAAPIYLNALTGKGVHLVTVNDFLARYQGALMGELYAFLGLTTAITQAGRGDGKLPAFIYSPGYSEPDGYQNLKPITRHEAYRSDILYTTNNEIGFDYLRDNMAMDKEQLAQRELNYAIVDEVDSILVDEARTPLIISGPGAKPTELYATVNRIIPPLKVEIDFLIDEKSKNATLTEDGIAKVESALGVENISDPDNLQLFQHVSAALRAHACYKKDVDYILKDEEVIIIDENTGRPMYGRRYSEGLHQAIEAKEGVKIERESQTLATITFQNFFRLYTKLSGMTGTAKTEEQEFIKIYGLPVAVIPTHREIARKDEPDVVYKTDEAKYRGIIGDILRIESKKQPVLVGTRSIEVSEKVSDRLKAQHLQTFALASILYRYIRNLTEFSEKQAQEFCAILKLRFSDAQAEQQHLEAALKRMELLVSQKAVRLVQPEEIRQMETRLNRAIQLGNEINSIYQELQAKRSLSASDAGRMSEIICLQKLENIRYDRLAKLMEVCGLPMKATDPENVDKLAKIINLDADTENLANLLAQGVPHKVLNAKYHEDEAKIIARAGSLGAVTIATNMAGRGVDIMLGGNPEDLVGDVIKELGLEVEDEDISDEDYLRALNIARERAAKQREQVVALGGLAIIGTERHESRRIDNQLRGRSGRQGDPGSSKFYVSMQDELMRLFGPDRFNMFNRAWEEAEPIEAKMITRLIENAQRKVESHNFEMRQHVLKYDDVMNQQRDSIYRQRRRVLDGEDISDSVRDAVEKGIMLRVNNHSADIGGSDLQIESLAQSLLEICPQMPIYFAPENERSGASSPLLEAQYRNRIFNYYVSTLKETKSFSALVELINDKITTAYNEREEEIGIDGMRLIERLVTLRVIDQNWMAHLDAMDFLREGIGLRGYAQQDPLVAYTNESYKMWIELMDTIQEEIATNIFRVRLVTETQAHERNAKNRPMATNQGGDGPAKGDRVAHSNIGRNDICPCGSGKKYKQCCGK